MTASVEDVLEDQRRRLYSQAAAGWYLPLSREVYLDHPFPELAFGRRYSKSEILTAIPLEKQGTFWHEMVHHLQFLATAQGIRALLVLCDRVNVLYALTVLLRKMGIEPQAPLEKQVKELRGKYKDVDHLFDNLRHRDGLLDEVFGLNKRIEHLPRDDKASTNTKPTIYLPTSGDPFVILDLPCGIRAKIHLDSLSLREGMALFSEHSIYANGFFATDMVARHSYLRGAASNYYQEELLLYHVLFLWWADMIPEKHRNWPTFLALCEIASMYDRVINLEPEGVKNISGSAPKIPHISYFLFLCAQLRTSSAFIDPVDEQDPSAFVESLLGELGWPDLRSQANRCHHYVETFYERNRGSGLILEDIFPFETILALLEYRRTVLGNRLLLFELLGSGPVTNRTFSVVEKLGMPRLYFSNVGFMTSIDLNDRRDLNDRNRTAALVDMLEKLYSRSSFSCRYFEEGRQEHCAVYRERGCEGNLFPGNKETGYQICSYGSALVRLIGEPMLSRKWLSELE